MPSSTPPTSRLLALEILCRWTGSRTPINNIFDSVTANTGVAHRDLQLTGALVFGVLRQQQYLDFILGTFAKHPLNKMKARTLFALRIGLLQLLVLDRIPQSAAVNETVKAFKVDRQPKWMVNFVNGVLRNAARNKQNLPSPSEAAINGQPILNHPEWLVNRWRHRFGSEKAIAICQLNNQQPALTLRTNTVRISRENLLTLLKEKSHKVKPGVFSPEALSLPIASGNIAALPGYEEGYFQVQDEAAQLASHLMPLNNKGTYLDACAGLGGKTSHLVSLAPENAQITAIEPEKRRYQFLGENLRRLKMNQVTVFNKKLEKFAENTTKRFDAILLDAPCSGTGVIRRQPDIRWNRLANDLPAFQQQQLHLLDTSASLLKEEGVLVYATCSMEPEENEEVIAAFLKKRPEFSPDNAQKYLPAEAVHLVDGDGYFHPTPCDGLDGFFAARLSRKKN